MVIELAPKGWLLLHLRVVIEFNLSPANPPNHSPTMTARKTAQIIVAKRSKESKLTWMGNEMLRSCGQIPTRSHGSLGKRFA